VTCCRFPGNDGILNINKPRGRTSFSIVAVVRHLTGEKRVGHAGTLDPMASGVLPVCIGQATRLVEYMMEAGTTYHAVIELGITTDTYDSEGKILARTDASHISRSQVEATLAQFRGEIEQTAPAYSAVKHQGAPLYKMARAGIAVPLKKRRVRVDRIELTKWQPPVFTLEIDCGKGTYVRAIAHDLGQVLGCGAYLKDLVRLRCGVFGISDALTPEELENAFRTGYWQELLYPLDSVLTGLPAVVVSTENEKAVCSGKTINIEGVPPEAKLCRAYNECGNLLAVLKMDESSGLWHPEKVFATLTLPAPCDTNIR
jgi:tRNA pseudouridine55 synthase